MPLTTYTPAKGIGSSGRAPPAVDGEPVGEEQSSVTGALAFNPHSLKRADNPGSDLTFRPRFTVRANAQYRDSRHLGRPP